jgi:S1-C subfamily serine protease
MLRNVCGGLRKTVAVALLASLASLLSTGEASALHRRGQAARPNNRRRAHPALVLKGLDALGIDGDSGNGGVVLSSVDPNGAGGAIGLEAGDVITAVNGTPVSDLYALNQLLIDNGGNLVSLTVNDVRRPGNLVPVPLSLPQVAPARRR